MAVVAQVNARVPAAGCPSPVTKSVGHPPRGMLVIPPSRPDPRVKQHLDPGWGDMLAREGERQTRAGAQRDSNP